MGVIYDESGCGSGMGEDPAPSSLLVGSEKDFHRAANALLNTLWQKTYSGSRSHEENWQEMDRQFPQARWLHDELKAAKARALATTEGQPDA